MNCKIGLAKKTIWVFNRRNQMDFLANPIYTGKYLEVDGVPNIIWASNTSHTYPLWLSLASLLSDWPKSAFGFSPHLTKTRMHFLASPNISQMGQLVYVKIDPVKYRRASIRILCISLPTTHYPCSLPGSGFWDPSGHFHFLCTIRLF